MAAIMSCPEVRASRAVLSGRWSSRDLLVCVEGEGISCQHQGGKGGGKGAGGRWKGGGGRGKEREVGDGGTRREEELRREVEGGRGGGKR